MIDSVKLHPWENKEKIQKHFSSVGKVTSFAKTRVETFY